MGAELPWGIGVCAFTLAPDHPEVLLVPDMKADARFNSMCASCAYPRHCTHVARAEGVAMKAGSGSGPGHDLPTCAVMTMRERCRSRTCDTDRHGVRVQLQWFLMINAGVDELSSRRRDREPFERFYCGVPLVASDGHRLGTMCVGGRQPRNMEGHMVRPADASRHTCVDAETRQQTASCNHSSIPRS